MKAFNVIAIIVEILLGLSVVGLWVYGVSVFGFCLEACLTALVVIGVGAVVGLGVSILKD